MCPERGGFLVGTSTGSVSGRGVPVRRRSLSLSKGTRVVAPRSAEEVRRSLSCAALSLSTYRRVPRGHFDKLSDREGYARNEEASSWALRQAQ
ncbi:hypothetical protein PLANTIT3_10006 [Plantibacter sp. T3]|nr:hypothetical protein PLANTIT3_10006 [Plantibacter sp. T3]